ncbi:ATP-binding protein [Roseateles noduli]|uniref:ATP-binding protein n=1 Tax=Roseateles noduli TaxID=2052484 RepID=UPI003D64AF23
MKKPNPRGDRQDQLVFTAKYFDHPIPRYNSNALIRALRPLPDHLELQSLLTRLPEYDKSERQLDRSFKTARLQELMRTFYIGLPRVVDLMEMLHVMICEGYMERAPFSAEDHARRQQLYELQESREFFQLDEDDEGSEFTSALMGIPGIGKSKALKRVSAPYRRVIYHPELNIYQIPALLIEMPHKGVSLNALGHAIIRALDKAFPQGRYYDQYLASDGNVEVLFLNAVALMQTHYVGVLLVDESQNQEYRSAGGRQTKNAVTGQMPLATLLISATNKAGLPMLMCGTPELRDILGPRASMTRRTVGRGMRTWKPLSLPTPTSDGGELLGEFDVVLQLLWDYQWTKTPFELTRGVRNTFYYYSQGITDVIVKLFHDIQLRAIRRGGDEVVTEELIHAVAQEELGPLTELTRAMREMDYDRTGQAADLAAYLRIDPHEMNFERRIAQEGLVDSPENAAAEEPAPDDDDMPNIPLEATQEPVEVPTGPAPKKPRKARRKSAPDSQLSLPDIDPVDNLDDALGG